jgi:hypothetical protein
MKLLASEYEHITALCEHTINSCVIDGCDTDCEVYNSAVIVLRALSKAEVINDLDLLIDA